MNYMNVMRHAMALVAVCGHVWTAPAADALVAGLGASAAGNRAAIQRAVDDVSAQGGGRVIVPIGAWTTGSIELKSGVELHLPKGCLLKGSTDRRDYNANDAFPESFKSDGEEWSGGHLVYGHHVENVAITGGGVIDGSGPAFFGECDEDSRWPWYKFGLKLHPTDRTWFRPGVMVAFFCSKNIRLEGVTLANTPAWTCHLRCCDGATIRGVTIDADRTIANSDGFSIDCTRNVTVEKCTLRTGDDGIAIRASCRCAGHAQTNFCENIRVRDCDIWSCCYGIRLGIGTGTIRNVEVTDTRVHEASESGIGFTPAWIPGKRNCHITDIRFRKCTVSECMRPVEGGPSEGDSCVTGILFEDCVFNTLRPTRLTGGPRCEISFVRCVRHPIARLKVRHRLGYAEREISNARYVFAQIDGDKSRIALKDCLPRPLESMGVLALSFDDRNFEDWERALPVFAKYGAHATFFICGEFDPPAIRTAKRLMAEGHSIGLHGQHHANAPETIAAKGAAGYLAAEITTVKQQCSVAYIPVRNFAYPNCRRDEASDKLLLSRFDRLRGGIRGVRPYDPKGEKRAGLKPLATDDRVFFPVAELSARRVLNTVLIGESYNTDIDDVVACIRRAGERRECLVLASHGIHHGAKGISMKTEWLEKILAAARQYGVRVLGYDEIPLR